MHCYFIHAAVDKPHTKYWCASVTNKYHRIKVVLQIIQTETILICLKMNAKVDYLVKSIQVEENLF